MADPADVAPFGGRKAFVDWLPTATSAYELKPWCGHEDDLSPCPCFTIDQPGFRAIGTCWRTDYSERNADGSWDACEHETTKPDQGGCCVHIWGDPALAAHLERLLDEMDWYGSWAVEIEADRA